MKQFYHGSCVRNYRRRSLLALSADAVDTDPRGRPTHLLSMIRQLWIRLGSWATERSPLIWLALTFYVYLLLATGKPLDAAATVALCGAALAVLVGALLLLAWVVTVAL